MAEVFPCSHYSNVNHDEIVIAYPGQMMEYLGPCSSLGSVGPGLVGSVAQLHGCILHLTLSEHV